MILRMKNKRRIARHTHTLLMEELAGVVHTMLKKDIGKPIRLTRGTIDEETREGTRGKGVKKSTRGF